MTDPASLSATFLDAFNRRDLDQLERMVAPSTDYLRSAGEPITTPTEVRARYAQDFELTPDIAAELTEVIAQNETDVAFEIRVSFAGRSVTGAAHHRWVDGRMTRYRSWTDPLTR
jgi:ketosteroid isomerase-like protein